MTKKCWWKCKNKQKETPNNEWEIIENNDSQTNCKKVQEELEDTKVIASKAQQDYIHLKMDFEHLRDRMEKTSKEGKIDAIFDVVNRFLPFVETLRKSIENIPEDEKDNNLAKWVIMTYNNFLKALEDLSIFPIDAMWLEPDTNLHEPVSMQPTEDKKQKWKIIMEFEKWFVYKKNWTEKVIKPSKVVVWQ